MNIKDIFEKAENGTLTYDQFKSAITESGAKFVDLSEGNYVSKQKYTDDLSAKDGQITTLNETIAQRDTDLTDLKSKLESAGTDATKLSALQTQFDDLQGKYDSETQAYKDRLSKQAYEFAVKEYANEKKFTSKGAKRDFERTMIEKSLQFDGSKILGADDFFKEYSTENADAFVVEKAPEDNSQNNQPRFAGSTNPQNNGGNPNPFNFNFVGVRPH